MVARESWTKTSEFEVFTLDNVLVLVWKEPPVVGGVNCCVLATETLLRTRPGTKFGFLTHVELRAQSGSPPEPVRTGLARFLRTNQSSIFASVIVYEGTGFKATIVRSVVTAIQLASGLDFPAHVSSSRSSGAAWLLDKMQGNTQVKQRDLLGVLIEDSRDPPYGR